MTISAAAVSIEVRNKLVNSPEWNKVRDFYRYMQDHMPEALVAPVAAYQEQDDIAVITNIPMLVCDGPAIDSRTLQNTIHQDICRDEAVAKKKWLEAGLKVRKMSPAKFVKHISKDKFPEVKVRDYGEIIKSLTAPLELKEAITPADYLQMHKVRVFSCMAAWEPHARTNGHASLIRNRMLERGHWQSDLYASIPYMRGMYLQQGVHAVARVFLLNNGGKWTYPSYSIKSPSTQFSNVLRTKLREEGFKSSDENYSIHFDDREPFEFDGIKDGERYLCPLPYGDSIVSPFHIKYIGDGKFRIGDTDGFRIDNHYRSGGYLADDYSFPRE